MNFATSISKFMNKIHKVSCKCRVTFLVPAVFHKAQTSFIHVLAISMVLILSSFTRCLTLTYDVFTPRARPFRPLRVEVNDIFNSAPGYFLLLNFDNFSHICNRVYFIFPISLMPA